MYGHLSLDVIRSEMKSELHGTDNVRGQLSVHTFAPNREYYLFSNSFNRTGPSKFQVKPQVQSNRVAKKEGDCRQRLKMQKECREEAVIKGFL